MNDNLINSNFSSYQNAFNSAQIIPFNGSDPKAMFNNHNFINQNNLIHNNLNNILLNEEIREYSVMIDSKDRNYQVYPDPFSYEVKFNPLPGSIEKTNGRKIFHQEPNPIINDSFTNVRYIKLEDVILPYFNKVKTINKKVDDELVKIWKIDTLNPITENLYTVLSIGEYKDINYRSTNDILSDSFATIYFDNRVNDTHFKGYTKNGIKIFPQDQLARIDKLRIEFMDPYGKLLNCNHINKKIKSNLECHCEDPECYDNLSDCFKHNLFHPWNPIFQHHLHFKVGVVEPRISKKTFN